ncbi:lycopene cyclase domain-containing protein [Halobellus inordinatus]|uniref:lycopene cyclase domain-containing protein n=1 Tax=Halobellus inordinatus TaxID=1126236 RepID=UPI00210E1610|nr:lycopene cyclase domain-containing protein [Halobellus inordinatus]
MTFQFTYLQFHFAFLLPAVMLLSATGFVSRSRIGGIASWDSSSWRNYWAGVATITVVALVYTTPWDNYLIARGVWWYGAETTVLTIGYAPLEEYLFIVVQPWLTALWLSHLSFSTAWPSASHPIRSRLVAFGLAVAICLGGWQLLGTDATFYLGATLAWAAPVLALQWVVGAPQLWARRRTVALGTVLPTLYLCVADRIAIEYGIWILSKQYTTGLSIAGLPIEEAMFFLVTNLFVVQGLVLYRLVMQRWADGTAATARHWYDRLRAGAETAR